jgi:uncharacterized OB-fold protein
MVKAPKAERRRPAPIPDLQTQPYWDGVAAGQLQLPRCDDCDRYVQPWMPRCPGCLRADLRWSTISGRGTVWSLCVMWADFVPGFQPPYPVAEIAIQEQPDLLIVSNIVGDRVEETEIGMSVHVVFESHEDGTALPQFELDPRQSGVTP